jgi:hypothetical protein
MHEGAMMLWSGKGAVLVIAGLAFLPTLPARGSIVPPGGSVWFATGHDLVLPSGDVLASDVRSVAIDYQSPPGTHFIDTDGKFTGTFTSRVIKDPASGNLSFIYLLDAHDIGGSVSGEEGMQFFVSSFKNFTTDIDVDAGGGAFLVSRSSDGQTINESGGNGSEGAPPRAVIATDATHFDRNGSIRISLHDELALIDSQGNVDLPAGGTAHISLEHTFEPVISGGTMIPLPPGAWSGLIGLGAVGIILTSKRATRRTRP